MRPPRSGEPPELPEPPPEAPDCSVVPIESLTREATWRRLSELARKGDPPPHPVVEAAMKLPVSQRWRSVDDELAALVYDSELDEDLLELVRSKAGAVRHLTFQAPQLALEVEVIASLPRRIACQVVPVQPCSLEVLQPDGPAIVVTRSLGTFVVGSLAPGPVSLRCRTLEGDTCSVATSWFRI